MGFVGLGRGMGRLFLTLTLECVKHPSLTTAVVGRAEATITGVVLGVPKRGGVRVAFHTLVVIITLE